MSDTYRHGSAPVTSLRPHLRSADRPPHEEQAGCTERVEIEWLRAELDKARELVSAWRVIAVFAVVVVGIAAVWVGQ